MQKYIIGTLIIICLVMFGLYQHSKNINDVKSFEAEPLPKNTQSQIVVENNKVKVKNKKVLEDGTEKAEIKILDIIPESKVTVELKDDNTLKVHQQKLGLCLKPGIGLFYGENLGIGISSRFVYFYNFGAFANVGIDLDKRLNINLGVDYRLTDWNMRNLAVGLGFNNRNIFSVDINIYFD